MSELKRRHFVAAAVLAPATLAGADAAAGSADDGHASGYDVAAAPGVPILPRRPGDPLQFTFPLDAAPIKATSGGWAREVTQRQLPLAAGIAGAHLFMNPGGSREMHWHSSADEWGYILGGQCQISALDDSGGMEVVNLEPGDLWFFPRGYAHAIQTLGEAPCHALLAFNDGLYSEHGTFGMSDWLSQLDPVLVAQDFGVPASSLAGLPKGETYIMQGPVIPLDGPQAGMARALGPERSHRYRLMARPPAQDRPGGTIHIATATEFPTAACMSTVVIRLRPGAVQEPHWHPAANEWHYLARGRVRVTLFGADKHLAVADMRAGECAYVPKGCGHSVQNLGTEDCELIAVLDAGTYGESSLTEWVAKAPRHLLANNLAASDAVLAALPRQKVGIAAPAS